MGHIVDLTGTVIIHENGICCCTLAWSPLLENKYIRTRKTIKHLMENKSLFMSFYVHALSFQFLKIINYSYFENCWCTSWKTSSKEKLFWNNYGAFMINYWVRSNIEVYTIPLRKKRERKLWNNIYIERRDVDCASVLHKIYSYHTSWMRWW